MTIASNGNVTITGGLSVGGTINMGNDKITSLATPTASSDAATKGYVDSVAMTQGDGDARYLRLTGGTLTGNLWFTRGTTAYTGTTDAFSFIVRTNNVNALTINSAQNATFAGNISTPGNVTASGQHLGDTGDSAALPSFSFGSDPDTGVWRAGTNALGFSTGAINRVTLNSGGFYMDSGNIWFNRGSSGYIGTVDAQNFAIRTDNTNRLVVLADGKIGLGTGSPRAAMHAKGRGNFNSTSKLGTYPPGTESNTFAAVVEGINNRDSGGLLILIDDENNDEKALDIYNSELDLRVFSASSSGDLYTEGKMRIIGGGSVGGGKDITSATAGGYLLLEDSSGATSGAKLRIDSNEMQVSSGTSTANLSLNPFGGRVIVGASATATADRGSMVQAEPAISVTERERRTVHRMHG